MVFIKKCRIDNRLSLFALPARFYGRDKGIAHATETHMAMAPWEGFFDVLHRSNEQISISREGSAEEKVAFLRVPIRNGICQPIQ
jgi:hypothetical protein